MPDVPGWVVEAERPETGIIYFAIDGNGMAVWVRDISDAFRTARQIDGVRMAAKAMVNPGDFTVRVVPYGGENDDGECG